jgi:glycerol-1-phosphate dehydrogenase [NAD(P)+]
MKAWGYADLLAKVTAGADWIVADVLGVEPIEPLAWNIVQGGLHDAVGSPALVRAGDRAALGKLVTGLMLGGFAMQSMRSSRPASGAEHQFSHLWDMEHHTHQGKAPSHGLKVGIGTIAVTALYERLLSSGQTPPVIPDDVLSRWPDSDRWRALAFELFDDPLLQELAVRETLAKLPDATELQRQLSQLVQRWPELQQRLTEQLIPLDRLRSMLRAVGAPVNSEKIGISRERLRESYRKALMIRRRFTILDLVARMGCFDQMLQELFMAPGGGALAGGRQNQDIS